MNFRVSPGASGFRISGLYDFRVSPDSEFSGYEFPGFSGCLWVQNFRVMNFRVSPGSDFLYEF